MSHGRRPPGRGRCPVTLTALSLLLVALLSVGGIPTSALAEAVDEAVDVLDKQGQDESPQFGQLSVQEEPMVEQSDAEGTDSVEIAEDQAIDETSATLTAQTEI